MFKKTFLTKLLAVLMVLALVTPFTAMGADVKNYRNWDVERYGDRIDVDAKLDKLSKDDEFLARAEKKIKAQAEEVEIYLNDTDPNEDNFLFDGGTKEFLDYDLQFKEFTLRSVGEYVEIWVARDLYFPEGDPRQVPVITQEQVDKLRDEFDSNIYPKATAFFGVPDALDGSNSPLIDWGYFPEGYYDGDKVIMLVDNVKDENYYDSEYPFFVAGFFWGTLEAYIDRNIITIDTNSWETRLESTFFGTTIHELQHLIHSDNDDAEESWINEGMSTFSEYLGGYGHDASSINFYLDHPENSLVSWDEHFDAATGPETIADYGQVYLFTLYMNDKFGMEFIRDLATNTNQGINSINEVMDAYNLNLDFTKLYQNFITALVLDSDKVGNGKYNFDSINLRELPVDKEGTPRGITVDFEGALTYEKEGVPAWGGDFKVLDFKNNIESISFDGVDFLPTPWVSVNDPLDNDNQVLWGNKGDEADNALIFEADLSNVTTATALRFDNYVQIEDGWDFGVVQVSADGGNTWKSLANEHTTSEIDPGGYPKIKENLPGFTGEYEGWQKEEFNLTEYIGKNILISFRYLTDWATNEKGWYIDNIEIPEIGFINDCSSTEGFMSMNELTSEYVEYTVTFINERISKGKKGLNTNYKILTIEPFDVTKEEALTLQQFFSNGNNYMITTYAAPAGDRNYVEFTYEIELKNNKPEKDKSNNNSNNNSNNSSNSNKPNKK